MSMTGSQVVWVDNCGCEVNMRSHVLNPSRTRSSRVTSEVRNPCPAKCPDTV